IGAWPFSDAEYPEFIARIKSYIVKAVREAKVHTAWLKPDTEYENAYVSFAEKILARSEANAFLKEFIPFCQRVSHYGILNSLSQTLIKITSPGVPDFYQGSELWDLSLVDPDNRRPVDFEKRRSMRKEQIQRSSAPGLIFPLSRREDSGTMSSPLPGGMSNNGRWSLLPGFSAIWLTREISLWGDKYGGTQR